MEPDLVGLGRPIPPALLGPHVDDDRTGHREGAPEGLEQRVDVVARHRADVGDPEVLEQLAGLGEPHDRRAEPATQLEDVHADHRDPLDGPVVGALAVAPRARQLDLAQVLRERPDGRADRHLVVVEHDEQLRLALADVVEGLEREAAHHRGVPDDDRDPLQAVADVARLGEPFGDRQPGPGMAAVEDVVGRLRATREAADAVELAKRPEPLESAGQELVRVGLVAGVPDDLVARRLHEPVERQRELDDAERRAQVTAGDRHGLDDRVADLGGELGQLGIVEAAQVGRFLEFGEDGHGRRGLLYAWSGCRRLGGCRRDDALIAATIRADAGSVGFPPW